MHRALSSRCQHDGQWLSLKSFPMQFFCPSWGYFGAKVSFFAETVLAFDEIVLEELSEVLAGEVSCAVHKRQVKSNLQQSSCYRRMELRA